MAGTSGHPFSKESREITINNGRKRISQLAAALRLGQHYVESAHRLFLIAVTRNFVQGRRTANVVAACLYIVCRRNKAPYLLIDFSDVLQTNVYILGTCFVKFCRMLNVTLPQLDPTLYIHRFASKLNFGSKKHQVAMTAIRLVQRFKRDWIQTGRRPAGICAAALLLAGRMHGFDRSRKNVVSVVRVCDQTLRNRLDEFSKFMYRGLWGCWMLDARCLMLNTVPLSFSPPICLVLLFFSFVLVLVESRYNTNS